MKLYLRLFRFNIFIARCSASQFFYRT